MRKFHLQNRRLQFVEPEISTDKSMMISRFHSMLAADSDARRQIFVVRNDCACVTSRTEIFGRVEAEATDVPDCASRPSRIGLRISGANGLSRVLHHEQVEFAGYLHDRVHVAAQPEKVHWDDQP